MDLSCKAESRAITPSRAGYRPVASRSPGRHDVPQVGISSGRSPAMLSRSFHQPSQNETRLLPRPQPPTIAIDLSSAWAADTVSHVLYTDRSSSPYRLPPRPRSPIEHMVSVRGQSYQPCNGVTGMQTGSSAASFSSRTPLRHGVKERSLQEAGFLLTPRSCCGSRPSPRPPTPPPPPVLQAGKSGLPPPSWAAVALECDSLAHPGGACEAVNVANLVATTEVVALEVQPPVQRSNSAPLLHLTLPQVVAAQQNALPAAATQLKDSLAQEAEAEHLRVARERDEAQRQCSQLQMQVLQLQDECGALKLLLSEQKEREKERELELQRERELLKKQLQNGKQEAVQSWDEGRRPPSRPPSPAPASGGGQLPSSSALVCSAITESGGVPAPREFQMWADIFPFASSPDSGLEDSFSHVHGLPEEEDPRVVRRLPRVKKPRPVAGLCC